jgi:hypothetical protein
MTSKFNRKPQVILFLPFEISTNSKGRHLGWRIKGWDVTHNFESGPTKEHFSSSL